MSGRTVALADADSPVTSGFAAHFCATIPRRKLEQAPLSVNGKAVFFLHSFYLDDAHI